MITQPRDCIGAGVVAVPAMTRSGFGAGFVVEPATSVPLPSPLPKGEGVFSATRVASLQGLPAFLLT